MSIYFDNAATSFPKPAVVSKAVAHFLEVEGGSPGRGFHSAALEADRVALACRQNIARLLHVDDSSRISFFLNATHAINQGLAGLPFCKRIVTTTMEHNAVLRPLYRLEEKGAELFFVQATSSGLVKAEAIISKAEQVNADLVVMQHASNVTGTVHDIETVSRWCRDAGVLFMVDASQTVGHLEVDLRKVPVDILAAPGHKGLLGPQGTGFLYVRPGLSLTPLLLGALEGRLPTGRCPRRCLSLLKRGR